MITSTELSTTDPRTAPATCFQSDLPVELETLGREIVARIAAGDKNTAHAQDLYLSAGRQLIDAKERSPDFKAFLRNCCGGLSRSRAYELIEIASGNSEEVRAKNRARDRRRRQKAACVREPRTPSAPVNGPQPPKSQAQRALEEFKVAVDTLLSKMDDDAKREAVQYVIANGGVSVP